MGEAALWNSVIGENYEESVLVGFNPSWESRPSGTVGVTIEVAAVLIGFNPSWESRPSGT